MVIFYSFNEKALVYIFPFTAHFFLANLSLFLLHGYVHCLIQQGNNFCYIVTTAG